MKACAITGQPPSRFKWKYKDRNNGCLRLKKRMKKEIVELYEKGIKTFLVGSAMGVDMWSAEVVLQLKKESCPDLELVVIIPYEGHDTGWDRRSILRLDDIYSQCDHVITLGNPSNSAKANYTLMNKYMIDCADCLISVYDNDRSIYSDAGMTVRIAEMKGLPIILIHPDTSIPSRL